MEHPYQTNDPEVLAQKRDACEQRGEREGYYHYEQLRLRMIIDDSSRPHEERTAAQSAMNTLIEQYKEEIGVIKSPISFTKQELDME